METLKPVQTFQQLLVQSLIANQQRGIQPLVLIPAAERWERYAELIKLAHHFGILYEKQHSVVYYHMVEGPGIKHLNAFAKEHMIGMAERAHDFISDCFEPFGYGVEWLGDNHTGPFVLMPV